VASGARPPIASRSDLKEVAEVRRTYEGCATSTASRILDYSVNADAASQRACFQFSRSCRQRTDFSPFVALEARTSRRLRRRQAALRRRSKAWRRYAITLRAGMPSTVQGDAAKVADYNHLCARPQPYVRFSGKAYVLPATGQRGISGGQRQYAVRESEIYRIGEPQPDRHLCWGQRLPAQHRPLDRP